MHQPPPVPVVGRSPSTRAGPPRQHARRTTLPWRCYRRRRARRGPPAAPTAAASASWAEAAGGRASPRRTTLASPSRRGQPASQRRQSRRRPAAASAARAPPPPTSAPHAPPASGPLVRAACRAGRGPLRRRRALGRAASCSGCGRGTRAAAVRPGRRLRRWWLGRYSAAPPSRRGPRCADCTARRWPAARRGCRRRHRGACGARRGQNPG
mmetsp:Transcript_53462/g.122865  ORF Transcript_53462/g.122865 Transcript_53462/m.122865 type:complete len:211 (+) Transcript_53462:205-837(+)